MIGNITASIVFAAAVTAAATGAGAGTKFDGTWSVVVHTTTGPCGPAYRFSALVVNGRISYTYSSIDMTGYVLDSGAAYVRVTVGSSHGSARGQMTATQGSGTWSGVGPDGHCSGTWVAIRPATS